MANYVDRYTYRVTWSEEDQEHVGLCVEFPSLSWLDKTPEKALAGIRKIISSVVFDMTAAGEARPQPIATRQYSGKFMVRVTPDTHRSLAVQAAEAGVSLNRFIASRLN